MKARCRNIFKMLIHFEYLIYICNIYICMCVCVCVCVYVYARNIKYTSKH